MKTIVWDAHTCIPLHPDTNIAHLHRHLNSGVSYVSVNVGMDFNPLSQILTTIASFREQIQSDDRLFIAHSTSDIEKAFLEKRLAVGFDLEGAVPLCERKEMIQLFWDLGVRQIHFAYNRNNSISSGCHDIDTGLTPLGKEMVAGIMNSKMLMDLSHMSSKSALDVCRLSSRPVIYSHANAHSLVPHPRNISNENIKACANTGGVICINGVERFLGLGQLSVNSFCNHVAYVADLVGVDHVGIGIDTFTTQKGLSDKPPKLDDDFWWPTEHYARGIGNLDYLQPEDIPLIHKCLRDMGFNHTELAQILGENMMRVAHQSWDNK